MSRPLLQYQSRAQPLQPIAGSEFYAALQPQSIPLANFAAVMFVQQAFLARVPAYVGGPDTETIHNTDVETPTYWSTVAADVAVGHKSVIPTGAARIFVTAPLTPSAPAPFTWQSLTQDHAPFGRAPTPTGGAVTPIAPIELGDFDWWMRTSEPTIPPHQTRPGGGPVVCDPVVPAPPVPDFTSHQVPAVPLTPPKAAPGIGEQTSWVPTVPSAVGLFVSTNETNKGIQPTATLWTANPNVEIHTTNYKLKHGYRLEVSITQAGGTGDASDITVVVLVVME